MQTQTFDQWSNQFRDWDRYSNITFLPNGNKQECSWSYTGPNATGLKSPVVCTIIVPNQVPTFNNPTVVIVPPTPEVPLDPQNPPVTVTPEPGTFILLGLGILALLLNKKFLVKR